MRLINTTTLEMREFFDANIPPYAILSHTWGTDEVSFQDFQPGEGEAKEGYSKIKLAAQQASKDDLSWLWVDTCCIDKTSSAELSEAINSMYRWYQKAGICYAYLSDVSGVVWPRLEDSDFASSRWFTRGWTLQELLAPSRIVFYGKDWRDLGSRWEHADVISKITGIDVKELRLDGLSSWTTLQRRQNHRKRSIAKVMSWASNRQTTRVEDIAYCLMGIFDVNMPLLYGEGKKAFIRLQQEILKDSDDHSIFAWRNFEAKSVRDGVLFCYGLLAESPALFAASGNYYPLRQGPPYSMTNKGLSLQLRWKQRDKRSIYALLACTEGYQGTKWLAIHLVHLSSDPPDEYHRVDSHNMEFFDPDTFNKSLKTFYVRQQRDLVAESSESQH